MADPSRGDRRHAEPPDAADESAPPAADASARALRDGSRRPALDASRVDERDGVQEPGAPAPIRPSDRVCAIGMTGSGKSQLLAHLWAIYPGQRLLVDVSDACELGPASLGDPAGYCRAEKVRDIDWRKRSIHFVPRSQSDRLYDDLYAAVFERGDLCVWLDESQGPTSPSRAPRWLRTTITQGRKRRILHLAATQEPMNVLPVVYSQAEHLCLFEITGRPDELRALAPRLRLRPEDLAAELDELPEHGFLRASTRDTVVRRMPPLPASVVEHARRHVRFVV